MTSNGVERRDARLYICIYVNILRPYSSRILGPSHKSFDTLQNERDDGTKRAKQWGVGRGFKCSCPNNRQL